MSDRRERAARRVAAPTTIASRDQKASITSVSTPSAGPNRPGNRTTVGSNRHPGSKSTKALKKSNNTGMFVVVGALLVVAALVLGGIIWWAKKDSGPSTVSLGQSKDERIELTDKGVVALGSKTAPKTIQVWEDFMCPACGSFEKAYGEDIAKAVKGDKLRVEYHMLNFLDRSSKTGTYSTRAIAAMQCVAGQESLDTTYAVKNALFANQPQEGGGDRTMDELASIAEKAGAKASLDCIKKAGSDDAMNAARDTASNSMESIKPVNPKVSTPTVAFEGKQVEFSDKNWLANILR